jgi:integrase
MPRLTRKLPSYCRHKASGQAVVTLDGRDVYLGPYGSPESKDAYDKAVAEWLARGRSAPPPPGQPPSAELTVSEVILAFLKHADQHYRSPSGEPTPEVDNLKDAMRLLRKLYGKTPARDFGPLSLIAVRDEMVRSKTLARGTINARVGRIRRLFRWAASSELIPATIPAALATVDALKRGRTAAHEAEPVKPAPPGDVETALPFMSRPVAAMVRLQMLIGCRPGEIVLMRGCDLTPEPEVWEYRPGRHKNAWRGTGRVIVLGPLAVALVREFLRPDTEEYLFRPKAAEADRQAEQRRNRKTPMTPSQRARRRKARPKRPPGDHYTTRSYHQAVRKACLKAGLATAWHPNQLRHNAATEVRARFGLEAAQAVLGHSKPQTTVIYAERDVERARKAMAEIG